jgi:hypothetical protein
VSGSTGPLPRLRRPGERSSLRTALIAVAALLVGIAVGRSAVADPGAESRAAVERGVLALALDADAIWTTGALGTPSVAEGFAALSDGDASVVADHAGAWLEAHDSVLVRIAGVDLPSGARPVQRQLVTAVTLSRDAVQVLERAAGVGAGSHRDDLLVEVLRLRQRSEEVLLAARASVDDLAGARRRIALLPNVRAFGGGPT